MERNVDVETDLATVSFALSQPSRCAILQALMGGMALSASELSYRAEVSNATTSAHLKHLMNAGLIRVTQTGRHRYYELTGHVVAEIVETLSVLAPRKLRKPRQVGTVRLRDARLCYDHLAGRLGVQLTNALQVNGSIVRNGDLFELQPSGAEFFSRFGLDISKAYGSRRCFARSCVDWSERQPHLAGALGAVVTDRLFDLGWIVRSRNDRSVTVTREGARGLHREFGIEFIPELGTET